MLQDNEKTFLGRVGLKLLYCIIQLYTVCVVVAYN